MYFTTYDCVPRGLIKRERHCQGQVELYVLQDMCEVWMALVCKETGQAVADPVSAWIVLR